MQGVLCEDLERHVDVVIGRGPVVWHFLCVVEGQPLSAFWEALKNEEIISKSSA